MFVCKYRSGMRQEDIQYFISNYCIKFLRVGFKHKEVKIYLLFSMTLKAYLSH